MSRLAILLGMVIVCGAAAGAASSVAAAMDARFPFAGRLVDGAGRPVEGTVKLRARFFRAATGGAEVAETPALELGTVALEGGVFQVEIPLQLAQLEALFGRGEEVWLELTAVDRSVTYPRQRLGGTPLALRLAPQTGLDLASPSGALVTLRPHPSTPDGTTYTLPAAPVSGHVLSTDASGNLQWVAPASGGGGGVASVSASPPLVSTGGATPGLSLPQATASQSGYLAASDWAAFDAKLDKAGGAVAGDLDLGGTATVKNLAAPAAAGDAATKSYVDQEVATRQTALGYAPVDRAGDALTGDLDFGGSGTVKNLAAPSAAADAATKGYVDAGLSAKQDALGFTPVNAAGDTLAGPLSLDGHPLSAVGHVTLAATRTLGLGAYTAAEEAALVASLAPEDEGKAWYNADTNTIRYWNGSAAVSLGAAGSGLGNLNGQVGNTQTLSFAASGTAPSWSSSSDDHQLRIPMASAAGVTAGLLSKSDYDAFSGKVARTRDTLTGDLDFGGTRTVKNLAAPSLASDAATKGYVDGAVAAKVDASGAAMTGDLSFGGTKTVKDLAAPSAAGDAATKGYVDGGLSGKVSRDGDTMTGDLSFGGTATVKSLAAPSAASDAATKGYVDAAAADLLRKDGSVALTGAWNVGAQDLANAGHVTLAAAKTLGLGVTATDPVGLVAADAGKVWFNTASGRIKYWDGAAVRDVLPVGGGLDSLNGLTGAAQTFATGTAGSDFAVSSSGTTHTFNLPNASATARGVVTTGAQTFAGTKTFAGSLLASGNVGVGTTAPKASLQVGLSENPSTGIAPAVLVSNSVASSDLATVAPALGLTTYGDVASGGARIRIGFYHPQGPSGGTDVIAATVDAVLEPTQGSWAERANITFNTQTTGASHGAGLTERMRITADGKVGIGTTAPGQTLSVAGSIGILEGGASPTFSTIFQGGDQAANVTYTLPTAAPSANGQVLSGTTAGVLSWTTLGALASKAQIGDADVAAGANIDAAKLGTGVVSTTELNYLDGVTSAIQTQLDGKASSTHAHSSLAASDGTPAQALAIDADGKVGIGTTTPGSLLHLSDVTNTALTVMSTGADSAAMIDIVNDARRWRLLTSTDDKFLIRDQTGSANRLTIDTAGLVGIGTTAPSEALDVNGRIRAGGGRPLTLYGDSSGGIRKRGSSGGWAFAWDAEGSAGTHLGGFGMFGNADALNYFYIGANYAAPLVTVLPTGEVGVGTPSPDRNLTVVGSGTSYITAKDGTREVLMGVDAVAGGGILSVMTNHPLVLRTGGNLERMRIDAAGNVGIGTTSPTHALDLRREISGQFLTSFENTNPNTGSQTNAFSLFKNRFATSQIGPWQDFGTRIGNRVTANGGAGDVYVTAGNDVVRMVVKADGNVGIGTSSPSAALSVTGHVIRNQGVFANGAVWCNGGITYNGTTFTCNEVYVTRAAGAHNIHHVVSNNANLHAICLALGSTGGYSPSTDTTTSSTGCRAQFADPSWGYTCPGTTFTRSMNVTCHVHN